MMPPIPLHATLPEGLTIRPAAPTSKGVGLVTTRAFDAGALLFRGEAMLISTVPSDPDSDLPYATLTVHDRPARDGRVVGVYPIHLGRHTTRLPGPGSTGRRLLHTGLGSLINHGCDPSTVVDALGDVGEEDGQRYEVRASRPLAAGDELTCDYTLAEYDATEKGIDPCLCGAPEGVCMGAMRGFKHLPLPHQLRRLGRVANPLFRRFGLDRQFGLEIVDRRDGPEGEGAVFLDCGLEGQPPRLLAARSVGRGAVVYEGRSRTVRPIGDYGGGYPQVILVVGPHALPLDPLPLFSSTFDDAGGREVYGCDALMHHACGARATTTWIWEGAEPPAPSVGATTTTAKNDETLDGSSHDKAAPAHSGPSHSSFCYRVLATRDLQAGEELTVDYRALSYRGIPSVYPGDGAGGVPSSPSRPPPAVGALGFRCECCGREIFR